MFFSSPVPHPIPHLLRILTLCLCLLTLSACDFGKHKSSDSDLILYGNIDIREVQLAFQDGG